MKKFNFTIASIMAVGTVNALIVLLLSGHYYLCAPITAVLLFVFLHSSFPFELDPVPLKANAVCGFLSAAPLFLSLITEVSPDNVNISIDGRLCFWIVFTVTAAVNCIVYKRLKAPDGRKCPPAKSVWFSLLNVTAFCIGIAVFVPVGAAAVIGYSFLRSV